MTWKTPELNILSATHVIRSLSSVSQSHVFPRERNFLGVTAIDIRMLIRPSPTRNLVTHEGMSYKSPAGVVVPAAVVVVVVIAA